MQVALAEEMAAPRAQEMERARKGSVEFLGRWNEKADDRAMPIKITCAKDREIDPHHVRVAVCKLVDELVQNGASGGILAISQWTESSEGDIYFYGFSWSTSPAVWHGYDVSYQRHGFVGMQSDQRQNIRFADFEGVVDDFGALSQIAVYRVTLPSGGLGLNWTPKRHGTVSPALAERIKVALLCAVRDRKRPHEERSLALLPNRILIHNIFSYLVDVKSVKWVGRPPPPAPEDLYTGPRSDGLLSTDEISGEYSAPGCVEVTICNSMTVVPLGPDAIETWRTGCFFLPCCALVGPIAAGAVRTRDPGTNGFRDPQNPNPSSNLMTFSADGTAEQHCGYFKKRPCSQKRTFQKVETRDLAGEWRGCFCIPFVPCWPLSHIFYTTKKALNEDRYEEDRYAECGCWSIPISQGIGTRTRKYVNGHPTNGFVRDGGKPDDPCAPIHWYRDPGCAGGSDGGPFFLKKVG